MKYIGRFMSKTQFWKEVAGWCSIMGVNADEVWDLTLVEFVRRVCAKRDF